MTDKKTEALKPCEYCGHPLPQGVDKRTRQIRSHHFASCNVRLEQKALAEQPAQQQEPVAWLSRDDARLALWDAINKREFGNPTDDKLILDHLRKNGLWIGKYTSPPASKPFIWLTNAEIAELKILPGANRERTATEMAFAVIDKLKELNT